MAVQCDVVGLLDGLLRHLLAVDVELDFLRRDADVELQERERGWREGISNKTFLSSQYFIVANFDATQLLGNDN